MNGVGPSYLCAHAVILHCVQSFWNLEAVAAAQISSTRSCKLWLNNWYPEDHGHKVGVWIITTTAAFPVYYCVLLCQRTCPNQ